MLRPLLIIVIVSNIVFAETQVAQKLREDLRRQPFDASLLTDYVKDPTPEITGIFWSEFQAASDRTTEGRERKQAIAAALCRMRVDDGRASAYLASLAEEAINSDAPVVFTVGKDGRQVKGKISPAFDKWSKEHGLKTEDAVRLELFTYTQDMLQLIYLSDPKYIYLFRRGLESHNLGVALTCVYALARLNDLSSLPWILAATKRNADSPEFVEGVAIGLTTFVGESATGEIRRVFAGTPALAAYEKFIASRLAHRNGK